MDGLPPDILESSVTKTFTDLNTDKRLQVSVKSMKLSFALKSYARDSWKGNAPAAIPEEEGVDESDFHCDTEVRLPVTVRQRQSGTCGILSSFVRLASLSKQKHTSSLAFHLHAYLGERALARFKTIGMDQIQKHGHVDDECKSLIQGFKNFSFGSGFADFSFVLQKYGQVKRAEMPSTASVVDDHDVLEILSELFVNECTNISEAARNAQKNGRETVIEQIIKSYIRFDHELSNLFGPIPCDPSEGESFLEKNRAAAEKAKVTELYGVHSKDEALKRPGEATAIYRPYQDYTPLTCAFIGTKTVLKATYLSLKDEILPKLTLCSTGFQMEEETGNVRVVNAGKDHDGETKLESFSGLNALVPNHALVISGLSFENDKLTKVKCYDSYGKKSWRDGAYFLPLDLFQKRWHSVDICRNYLDKAMDVNLEEFYFQNKIF